MELIVDQHGWGFGPPEGEKKDLNKPGVWARGKVNTEVSTSPGVWPAGRREERSQHARGFGPREGEYRGLNEPGGYPREEEKKDLNMLGGLARGKENTRVSLSPAVWPAGRRIQGSQQVPSNWLLLVFSVKVCEPWPHPWLAEKEKVYVAVWR